MGIFDIFLATSAKFASNIAQRGKKCLSHTNSTKFLNCVTSDSLGGGTVRFSLNYQRANLDLKLVQLLELGCECGVSGGWTQNQQKESFLGSAVVLDETLALEENSKASQSFTHV